MPHAPAPQRLQRGQRNGGIWIRRDDSFEQRGTVRESHPPRVRGDRLGNRRPDAWRRVFRQLSLEEAVGGGDPRQQANKRLSQHFLGHREKTLLLG